MLTNVYLLNAADQPSFRPAADAFRLAILTGRLSNNPTSTVYAGKYMYMGTWNGVDAFKSIDTREYLR